MYDNTSDEDNKVIKDFVMWEDENIIKLEILENMLDNLEYNEICEEFVCWRSKNELSQNN